MVQPMPPQSRVHFDILIYIFQLMDIHKCRSLGDVELDYDVEGNWAGDIELDYDTISACTMVCREWHTEFVPTTHRRVWMPTSAHIERLIRTAAYYPRTFVKEIHLGHCFTLSPKMVNKIWNTFPDLIKLDLGRDVNYPSLKAVSILTQIDPNRLVELAYNPCWDPVGLESASTHDEYISVHTPPDVPRLWLYHGMEMAATWNHLHQPFRMLPRAIDRPLQALLKARQCGLLTRVETISFSSYHHLLDGGCPEWLQKLPGYRYPPRRPPPLGPSSWLVSGYDLVTQFIFRSESNDWAVHIDYRVLCDLPRCEDGREDMVIYVLTGARRERNLKWRRCQDMLENYLQRFAGSVSLV